MEKRLPLIRLTLLLLMLVGTIMGSTAHDIEIDGIYYNCPSPSNLHVTTNNGQYNSYSGDVVVPASILYNNHRYKVTAIDSCAFRGCTELSSVTIQSASAEGSVRVIGKYAFYDCPQLTRVVIPDGVTEIKDYTFANCTSLESVDLPAYLTTIGANAFSNCTLLANIELPESVTTIGGHAFENCTSLLEIDLPSKVSSVGSYAFADCSTMTTVTIPASLKTINDHVFYRCRAITEVVIPNTTTFIGANAFQSCTSMEKLVLGEAVATLSSASFKGCIALKNIFCLSKTVPSVTGECFSEATYNQTTLNLRKALADNYMSAPYWRKFKNVFIMPYEIEYEGIYYVKNTINSVDLGVSFKDYDYNSYKGDVVIPRGFSLNGTSWKVTTIAADAFRDCDSLTSVTIPSSSITSIDDRAFMGCTMLPALSVPASVTQIGKRAFAGCTALSGITLPDAMTVINDSTFEGCSSLTSLTLPGNIKSIGADVFNGCTSLESITIGENVARLTVDENALNGCTALKAITCKAMMPPIMTGDCFNEELLNQVTLYVQPSSLIDYQLDPFWGRFANIKTTTYDFIYNGIYYIITSPTEAAVSNHAPEGGSYTASSITIPEKVTYAGDDFKVTAIGKGAFLNCGAVKSVSMPQTISSIGEQAFMKSGITGISIPSKVSVINKQAFMECTKLTSMTIPNHVYTIEDSAFYGCSELKSLDLGQTVTFISNYAFAGCYNLTNLFIPHTVEVICSGAFQDCTVLKEVKLDMDFKQLSLDGDVFKDCYHLATITSFALTPPDLDNQRGGLDSTIFKGVTLMVPYSCVNAYSNADVWGEFANIKPLNYDFIDESIYYRIVDDNNVSVVNNGYTNCYKGEINVPGEVYLYDNLMNVTVINPYTFAQNNELRKVTLPNSVTEIGRAAFWQSSVKQVTLPKNITEIKNCTFYNCQSLESITIPSKVTAIGDSAFFFCVGLHDIVLPNSLTTIGNVAFIGIGFTSNNVNINLPNSLTKIGIGAFMAASIREVTIPNSLDSIAANAFGLNSVLTKLTIPNSVKYIGAEAFALCQKLKSLTIPNSVQYIDAGAFAICTSLDTLVIGSGVEHLGISAFANYDEEEMEVFNYISWPEWMRETIEDWIEELTHPFKSVTCLSTTPPTMSTYTFNDRTYNQAMLSVPKGSVSKYKNAEGWKRFVYVNSVSYNDVNDDGEVNIADVNCVIDAITSGAGDNPSRIDVNNDDEINIADVNAIIKEILYGKIVPL